MSGDTHGCSAHLSESSLPQVPVGSGGSAQQAGEVPVLPDDVPRPRSREEVRRRGRGKIRKVKGAEASGLWSWESEAGSLCHICLHEFQADLQALERIAIAGILLD